MAEGGHSKRSMYWFESNVRHHFVEKIIHFFQRVYAHFVQWKGRNTTDVEI